MKNIVNNIEIKLGKFIAKYEEIKQEKLLLQQENNASIAALKLKEEEVLNLQEKIKLMNISKSVDASKQEVKETRLKINEYVREIDKCIALLNK
ncbi:MAG: hypothetical protein HON40_02310 [Flavobacteriales bacterium]|nr:hypothetical protein [Flavobacteriales bacterium]MBT4881366.1 hypothetical protein [Flavobacteriales bacterium]MDC3395145.1 hypothetical protein [Flavobacteriales bacterium]MDG1348726.1 hypothetical protein [Flavobacteriales bacterium]